MFARLFFIVCALVFVLVAPATFAQDDSAAQEKAFAKANGIYVADAAEYLWLKSEDDMASDPSYGFDPKNPKDVFGSDFDHKYFLPTWLKCMQAFYQADQVSYGVNKAKIAGPVSAAQRAKFQQDWTHAGATAIACAQMTNDAADFAGTASDVPLKTSVTVGALNSVIQGMQLLSQEEYFAERTFVEASNLLQTLSDKK